MPFTPTHIVAVLPFAVIRRGTLPFSALVIGAMIPDLPLFVPGGPTYGTTHSLPGLFTTCLPLGLAGYLIFQYWMKRPLFALLPGVIQRRCVSLCQPAGKVTPRFLGHASLAIATGAATHQFWDAFTHSGRWGTRLIPQLQETALVIGGHPVPGYKLLQYGSTLIGLPVLVVLLAIWFQGRRPEPLGENADLAESSKRAAYLIALAIPVGVTSMVWLQGGSSPYIQLGRSITISGLVLMVATLAYCLAYNRLISRPNRAE
jgi:hypothetical protein